MEIVQQSVMMYDLTYCAAQRIERAGRTCYQSQDRIESGTADDFVRRIIKNGHHSVLEHASATVCMVTSRRITHELVRHRLFSFSQESTRYCTYDKDVQYIEPHWWDKSSGPVHEQRKEDWLAAMEENEKCYKFALHEGWPTQDAGELLNNALKAEIVVTGNVRQWRHFLVTRLSPKAHPQMRKLAADTLCILSAAMGKVLFEDITHDLS